jgi:hypothetical protein
LNIWFSAAAEAAEPAVTAGATRSAERPAADPAPGDHPPDRKNGTTNSAVGERNALKEEKENVESISTSESDERKATHYKRMDSYE